MRFSRGNRIRFRWYAILACGVLVSCGEDSPTVPQNPATGSVFVRVKSFGQPIRGATVLTRPETSRHETDALGSALLDGLEPRVYTLWATHPSAGSGNAALTVIASQTTNLDITLQPGLYLQPIANILSPAPGSGPFSYVDSITFSGVVSDLEDPASSLTLQWSSSRDGLLWNAPTTNDGVTTFVIDDLTNGQHWIRLSAQDPTGFTGIDSVSVTVEPLPPSITIVSPGNQQGFTPGETITFQARVADRETPEAQLTVEWRSDRDGVLDRTPPDADGNVSFATTNLTAEQHRVTLRVTDGDGLNGEAEITVVNLVPPPVESIQAMAHRGRVTLTWTATSDPLFARYEIHRGATETDIGTLIGTVQQADQATYVDALAPLAPSAWYRVHVVNNRGYFRPSPRVAVSNPGGLLLANVPDETLIHPSEDWLYLRFGATLFRVDLVTMEIADTGSLQSSGWMDIGDNGMGVELYSPGSDGWIRIFFCGDTRASRHHQHRALHDQCGHRRQRDRLRVHEAGPVVATTAANVQSEHWFPDRRRRRFRQLPAPDVGQSRRNHRNLDRDLADRHGLLSIRRHREFRPASERYPARRPTARCTDFQGVAKRRVRDHQQRRGGVQREQRHGPPRRVGAWQPHLHGLRFRFHRQRDLRDGGRRSIAPGVRLSQSAANRTILDPGQAAVRAPTR